MTCFTVLTLVLDITWFLEDNLDRQSRDHFQNNYQKSRKHVVLNTEKNLSKP